MGSLFREQNELVHLRYFLTVLARGKRDELVVANRHSPTPSDSSETANHSTSLSNQKGGHVT